MDPVKTTQGRLEESLFSRAHKSALGLALGLVCGFGLFFITVIHIVTGVDGLPLHLLDQYFKGYAVSWGGAFAGLGWGLAAGFVAGWLLGFVHNFTVGIWLFVIRTKHDLARTGNFLDHI